MRTGEAIKACDEGNGAFQVETGKTEETIMYCLPDFVDGYLSWPEFERFQRPVDLFGGSLIFRRWYDLHSNELIGYRADRLVRVHKAEEAELLCFGGTNHNQSARYHSLHVIDDLPQNARVAAPKTPVNPAKHRTNILPLSRSEIMLRTKLLPRIDVLFLLCPVHEAELQAYDSSLTKASRRRLVFHGLLYPLCVRRVVWRCVVHAKELRYPRPGFAPGERAIVRCVKGFVRSVWC